MEFGCNFKDQESKKGGGRAALGNPRTKDGSEGKKEEKMKWYCYLS